jgi:hypothetical protein
VIKFFASLEEIKQEGDGDLRGNKGGVIPVFRLHSKDSPFKRLKGLPKVVNGVMSAEQVKDSDSTSIRIDFLNISLQKSYLPFRMGAFVAIQGP